MADEEWLRVASEDDNLVAELLIQLKQAEPPPPPPQPERRKTAVLSTGWSVRQRRSRAVAFPMKTAPPTRASPTTPLSWSGATSVSGGAGGSFEEESGDPLRYAATRSKIIRSREAEASNSKKPKRKKTIAELKEEEEMLDEERRQLKKEVAAARRRVERERATNLKLKRMKMAVELQQTPTHDPVTAPFQPVIAGNEEHREFVLPDLNIPLEDSSSNDVPVCGFS